ncbi:MAG: hypothetical protein UR94_C0015G0012 [Parcubacteria group bacterium GW2011_GWA2_36_10]|nr:MAG: hypothetical protein UR94_C0015G0012 [Parcubacteria group bacterium GW2011_GWA2_36_10]
MKKLLAALLLLPNIVLAQGNSAEDALGINDLREQGVNLGNNDLKGTIAKIINIILSFLGVLAVLIILLGGFKWMTSQGSTEKVDEAKKLIAEGVVGLVIIFAAYAIASFVLNQLYTATTGIEQ